MAKPINLDISAQEKNNSSKKMFFGSDYLDNCPILYLSGIWEHASLIK